MSAPKGPFPLTLNMLTFAVVDVDDSVPIAQSLGDAADEALGAHHVCS
jgi:hypothetical protein